MGKLAAISRNEFTKPYSIDMHKQIAFMTGTAHPRVLLIPLASHDDKEYISTFTELYLNRLGCAVDVLLLHNAEPEFNKTEKLFAGAQLIFIGGGENFSAINRFKLLGIDRQITAAFHEGKTVAGEGTGAVFLFEGGYIGSLFGLGTDTPIVYTAKGIGLVEGFFCPNINDEYQKEGFAAAMLGNENTGFGIESGCALFIKDDHYKNVSFVSTKGFYGLTGYEEYVELVEAFSTEYKPLDALYADGISTYFADYETERLHYD